MMGKKCGETKEEEESEERGIMEGKEEEREGKGNRGRKSRKEGGEKVGGEGARLLCHEYFP